jgi:AcrR family transcriptional regulator
MQIGETGPYSHAGQSGAEGALLGTAIAEREAEAPVGRREQAKSERRARIVEAACELLREVGLEEMGMKALAARAGLSQSTVYNLFGSKQAVLAAVFDLDLNRFEALVAAAASPDPLERLFDTVDLAVEVYRADEPFYRAVMWRRPNEAGEMGLGETLREPRSRYWRALVEDAIAHGRLTADADPAVLAAMIIQIFGGVLADWIGGDITLDQMRDETKLGFAAALSAFATEPSATALRERARALHARLAGRN